MNNIFTLLVRYPRFVLLIFALITAFFSSYIPKLSIDASSQTLMLKNDKDLEFYRKMNEHFKTSDFLVVTYSPFEDLLSKKSLKTLQELSLKLSQISSIQSVTSILNVPLFDNKPKDLEEKINNPTTLLSDEVDLTKAKEEFLKNPLYRQNIISLDFKTTALVLNLKKDTKYFEFLNKIKSLEQSANSQELEKLNKEFKAHRDFMRQNEHANLEQIRKVLLEFKNEARLFLGGVNMISDDMITYVKNDIIYYSTALAFLLVLTLWIIFRQIRWVILPLFICLISVLIASGMLGFLGLELTVISSNFISLQLIITLSIAIHLVVAYRQEALNHAKSDILSLHAMLDKAKPSFFAVITTIAGFFSLIFSNILPIINLGIMMSLAIAVSLIVAFGLFGAINSLLPVLLPKSSKFAGQSITKTSSKLALSYPKSIFACAIFLALLSVYGASKLEVENSFINYFKSSTQIYKGMEVIDTKLGGTTPLDIVIKFKDEKKDESFSDSFEDEFSEDADDPKYYFTAPKIEIIKKVHAYLKNEPFIGYIQSIDTLFQVGEIITQKPLDGFFISLLYSQMPSQYKALLIDPFVNIDQNSIRFSARIIDSNSQLRRAKLIEKIERDLEKLIPKNEASFKLSSFMILYNNMLQSLYESQIKTIGFVILALLGMFWILFRSFYLSLIAIITNIIPMGLLFAFMGFANIPLNMMSITIAAISIGIGVDDTIHYIVRFKEEFAKCQNYKTALLNSHESIGYAMFYTSISIVLGFLVLVVSNFIPTIYFGLLTDFVMIMCLISSLLLLPVLLTLFKPFKKGLAS